MDSKSLNVQVDYWNRVAEQKNFSHPFRFDLLEGLIKPNAAILDYGCGYGRTCAELWEHGYSKVIGIDPAAAMIERGLRMYPHLNLLVQSSFKKRTDFDLVILFAVLTCVPTDDGQQKIIDEIFQLLKPGGFIYISDLLLQRDARNLRRYDAFKNIYNKYGVFELPEGAVLRHHDVKWIAELTHRFQRIHFEEIHLTTMNGHDAVGFQFIGQK
ncbi:methyltransferase domain-containing protein [candidate division KSB1 bacterium]|nr:methyltransferase domain-containing protein [candidate division KSB1 bacterium]